MPSNQYRPLTKPRYGNQAGSSVRQGALRGLLYTPNLVARCYRALTLVSGMMMVLSLLASLDRFATVVPATLRTRPDEAVSTCDSFLLPGYLAQLPSGLATYRTYDPSCTVQGFLPTLLASLPSSPYHNTVLPPKHLVTPTALSTKVANRTVLMIGDETDHFLLQHLCTLLGQSVLDIDATHPWGRGLLSIPREHVKNLLDPSRSLDTSPGQRVMAHACYEPQYNFLLVSTYHMGADVGDIFQGQPAWTPPGRFEDRLQDLVIPMIEAMAKPQPQRSNMQGIPPRSPSGPDAVILSSSFWDLARYAEEDGRLMRSLVDDLSEHRLLSWRARHVDMLSLLGKTWKQAKLGWRSLHAPPDTEETTLEWWIGTEQNTAKTPSVDHPLFHMNRIAALNAARRSVLYPHGDDIVKGRLDRTARLPPGTVDFDWGALMLGQDHHQVDRVHPGLSPGGSLFGEMLLQQML